MNKKNGMIFGASLVLTAALVATGTYAYLTSQDEDVNVMTLGNVKIEQIEQQANENKELESFEQGKPLYPAVYEGDAIEMANPEDYIVPGVKDWEMTFASENVVDKIVTVKNTGASDAYVRTIIAIETGKDAVAKPYLDVILNTNDDTVAWETYEGASFADTTWTILVGTYKEELAPGEVSMPSLKQICLMKEATNEVVASLGEVYEVLVVSQAVQTEGFADAPTALNEAFGEINATNHPWVNGYEQPILNEEDLRKALASGATEIVLVKDIEVSEPIEISKDVKIFGSGKTISRKEGYTGDVIVVKNTVKATLENVVLDGEEIQVSGSLIRTEGNGSVTLNEGAIVQNNNGALAINLATRGGGTLTIDGGEVINNSSSAGAIWGGGNIVLNNGKISNNSSTGLAGAIRMVGGSNFTMNGGEMSYNTAATSGGAIWGYGASVYNFNGGIVEGNQAAAGGVIYTGDGSTVNISGDVQIINNKADDVGAFRLSNRTTFKMTGGTIEGNESTNNPEWDGFYGWNPIVNISGGNLADAVTIQGGLTPTVGGDGMNDVIYFAVSTTHNTVNLAKDFDTFKFHVAEGSNFNAFNFTPAADYVYTAGDEAKLICTNEGYVTYWDEANNKFKLKAE